MHLFGRDIFQRRARSLAAEMHSGFAALRTDCPMNLRCAYAGVPVAEAVRAGPGRERHVHLVLENDDNAACYLGGFAMGLATPLLPCAPLYLLFGATLLTGSAVRGAE